MTHCTNHHDGTTDHGALGSDIISRYGQDQLICWNKYGKENEDYEMKLRDNMPQKWSLMESHKI
jgi:hypothetical protein